MKNMRKINKKLLSVALLVIAVISLMYFFLYEPGAPPLPSSFSKKPAPLLIGHRGAGDLAPENTLAAFRLAMEIGLDGAELDMQLSKDKQVIVFHDPDLERLTNGTGLVKEKTLAELKELDAGSKFSDKFSSERIPTLDEVLELVSGKLTLILEIKSSDIQNDGLENALVDIIRKHNAFDWVIVDSFNPVSLWRVNKLEPKIMIAFDFRDSESYDPTIARGVPWPLKQEWFRRGIRKVVKPNFLEPEFNVKEKTLSQLSSKGYPMVFWTVNSEEELNSILKWNPWGIITDTPNTLSKIMKKGGKGESP
jgi:glycerophosphoryl diester phosphodiesterase